MKIKYTCCKGTLAIYDQWITAIQETQYHQGLMPTDLMDSLKKVLWDFTIQEKIPAHKISKSRSKCTNISTITRSKAISTNNDSHTFQISCTLLKCKHHEQSYLVKDSNKNKEIVGISAASLNSPKIPINARDVARVLRCLR